MKLVNNSKNNCILFDNVKMADNAFSRMIGLMGSKPLSENTCLWIKPGNWIHTFFMLFPIDVIYVSKKLEVKRIHKNVKPWRMAAPVFSAHSLFECPTGVIDHLDIEIGDKLHVGS